jgi:DNA-binding NtrC family response regulator
MNILAIKQNEFQSSEIEEMIENNDSKVFFLETISEALKFIDKNSIDIVLINITSVSDIGFIKYINDNFSNTQILLSTDEDMQEAISVIQTGDFKLLHHPLLLNELKKEIN